MESFQKALMLDQNHIQSLQLRGMMLYHHGSLQEAIGNFKVRLLLSTSLTHFEPPFPVYLTCLSLTRAPEVPPAGAIQRGVPIHEGVKSRGHGAVLRGHQGSD